MLRSDGSPERDFLYVEDAAGAYLAIADALDRHEVRGEAFNAGGGAPHSVREVVALIARLADTGVEPDIRGAGNPDGRDRPPVRRPDEDPRARSAGSRRSTSRRACARTIDWYREHPEALAPPPPA